jgi:hypothetical protein
VRCQRHLFCPLMQMWLQFCFGLGTWAPGHLGTWECPLVENCCTIVESEAVEDNPGGGLG